MDWNSINKVHVRLALLTLFVLGLMYTAVTPPFESPDEPAHFLRAQGLAEGQIIQGDHPGPLIQFILEKMSVNHDLGRIPILAELMNSEHMERVPNIAFNSSLYSPVPYLHFWAGLKLADALGSQDNYHFKLYLCRIINLILFCLILAFIYRKNQDAALPFFWLAATPMVLSMASVVSIDAFLLGAAMLVVIYSISPMDKAGEVILPLSMLALALTKPPYAVLFLLPLASFYLFPGQRKWPYFLGLLLSVSAVLTWEWYVGWTGTRDLAVGLIHRFHSADVDPAAQLKFALSNPLHFSEAIWSTILSRGAALGEQMAGVLGWLHIHIPRPAVWAWYAGLGAVILCQAPGQFPRGQAVLSGLFFLLAAVGVSLAVMLSLYMIWMPVGAGVIDLQGRYFHVPLLVAMLGAGLLLPGSVRPKCGQKVFSLFISLAVLINLAAIYSLLKAYA